MKNKLLSIILVLIVFLTTGCGNSNYITDEKGKVVINELTGQNLQKDIYCRPEKGSEVYKLYEKYEDQMKFKLSKLPECNKFKITSNKKPAKIHITKTTVQIPHRLSVLPPPGSKPCVWKRTPIQKLKKYPTEVNHGTYCFLASNETSNATRPSCKSTNGHSSIPCRSKKT